MSSNQAQLRPPQLELRTAERAAKAPATAGGLRREEKTRRNSGLGELLPLPVLRERAGVRVISSTRARCFQITLTPTLSRSTRRGGKTSGGTDDSKLLRIASCKLQIAKVENQSASFNLQFEIPNLQSPTPSPRFAASFAPESTGRGGLLRGSLRPRRGFTFTEILFSVLILGIGFILIAAIFPVALKQTQSTAEETEAATIAKGGVSYLQKYSTQSYWNTPVTGTPVYDQMVHPIGPYPLLSDATLPTNTTLWPLISGNLILPSDPRYAWVPMYRQGLDPTATPPNSKPLPYIQVIVIGVQARNRSFYDSNDLAARPPGTNGTASLEARPLQLSGVGNEQFTFADIAGNSYIGCVSDGAFVVIASDTNAGLSNGFIYRLGTNAGGTTWGLAPGNDIATGTTPPGNGSIVLVIGAGYSDATTTSYYGPCQDVAAYTTFITVH
jgi:type II secretory pathway pseudopilin PulG